VVVQGGRKECLVPARERGRRARGAEGGREARGMRERERERGRVRV
jgi:hypothetical protein